MPVRQHATHSKKQHSKEHAVRIENLPCPAPLSQQRQALGNQRVRQAGQQQGDCARGGQELAGKLRGHPLSGGTKLPLLHLLYVLQLSCCITPHQVAAARRPHLAGGLQATA